jgi:hypothetical protein
MNKIIVLIASILLLSTFTGCTNFDNKSERNISSYDIKSTVNLKSEKSNHNDNTVKPKIVFGTAAQNSSNDKKPKNNGDENNVIVPNRYYMYSFNKDKGVYECLCKNAEGPLKINTYDGSGQAMHPKVLYFNHSWNGWKYWMSYTPYPLLNDKFENPSITVSQDGVNWKEPISLKNPVIVAPPDVKSGGHNSDPQLVMHGPVMELWYRFNPASVNGKYANSKINQIFRITSVNGIKWSRPQLVLNGNYKYFSPDILFDNNRYKVWFSDLNGKLYYTESTDLKKWSTPVICNLKIKNYSIWHQDMIKTNRGYEIVFSAYHTGQFDKNNQCLYYSISSDGINFKDPVLILTPSTGKNQLDDKMIYRSSIVDIDGKYGIYYSAMDNNSRWHTFLTDFNPGNLKE